jgi:hypothetical protein
MSEPNTDPAINIQIKADEKDMVGNYANLAQISHRHDEFTLSFFYIYPNVPQGKLLYNVVLSPSHAKRLLRAIQENIERYERLFGAIREEPGVPEPNIGFVQ